MKGNIVAQRVLAGVQRVHVYIAALPGVTKVCVGKPDWCRGKHKKLKFEQNGQSNHICIHVCESEGQQALHVYGTNIGAIASSTRSFGERNGYKIQG